MRADGRRGPSSGKETPGGAPSEDPLFGERVERALAELRPEHDALRVVERLRVALGDGELARRAAQLHELRRRAGERLGAERLPYLTAKGLEQASAAAVAAARAARLAARLEPGARVWDATCGVGSDTLALVEQGLAVLASDRDPEVLRCARANLTRAGRGAAVLVADASRPPFLDQRSDRAPIAAVLIDPDRRAAASGPDDRRARGDPGAWSPSLEEALATARRFPAACLKLPPAFDPADLAPHRGERRAWSWVSLAGELREVTLWLGRATADAPPREALLLGGRGSPFSVTGEPLAVEPLGPEDAARVAWLAEPDPAVLRAGLLGSLALELGLAPLGPRLAYLGGAAAPDHPALRTWPVLGTAPLDPRRVRALLARHDVGPLVVKKRGHPDPAAVLATRLRGRGRKPGLLAVARLARGHLALLLGPEHDPAAGRGGR